MGLERSLERRMSASIAVIVDEVMASLSCSGVMQE